MNIRNVHPNFHDLEILALHDEHGRKSDDGMRDTQYLKLRITNPGSDIENPAPLFAGALLYWCSRFSQALRNLK
jgi:hypothetical protein